MTLAQVDGARVERLCESMRRESLDLVILTNPASVRYISGFFSSAYARLIALVIDRRGRTALVVPALELPLARRYTTTDHVVTYGDRMLNSDNPQAVTDSPVGGCAQALRLLGVDTPRVGIELNSISAADFHKLEKSAGFQTATDVSGLVPRQRAIKSSSELTAIREAAMVANASRSEAVSKLVEGATEAEIVGAGLRRGWLEASNRPDRVFTFFGNVVAGPRSDAGGGHDLARGRRVANGEVAFFAWGASCDGYWAMAGRSVVVGDEPLPPLLQDAFSTAREALQRALHTLKAGTAARAVHAAAEQVISASPFKDVCTGSLGSGMGLSMSEPPVLGPRSEDVIEPGMAMRIGHEIYLHGLGTVTCKCFAVLGDDGKVDLLISAPSSLSHA